MAKCEEENARRRRPTRVGVSSIVLRGERLLCGREMVSPPCCDVGHPWEGVEATLSSHYTSDFVFPHY